MRSWCEVSVERPSQRALVAHKQTQSQFRIVQAAIGMGAEDAQMVVESMAQTGVEPTYCMGDDIPLAVLSDKPHMLADYFKQRFAQVGAGGCLRALKGGFNHAGNHRHSSSRALPRVQGLCLQPVVDSLCIHKGVVMSKGVVITSHLATHSHVTPGDQPADRPAARGPGDVP